MILQALTRHYEDLLAAGELPPFGWNQVKVSYVLTIDEQGRLLRAASIRREVERGEKKVMIPQLIPLPAPYKRAVNIKANFLCDNATYILGHDGKGKPARTRKCFEACKALHEQILSDVDSPPARALLCFFQNWEPEKTPEHPALQDVLSDVIAGANLVFWFQGAYVHDDPAIRQAWQSYYNADGDGPVMTCLVTGQRGPVEAIHPALKGVPGAQPVGAALVSFNAPAFCSYGQKQNFNAPTGKYAAFAYTAALNHLLADRDHTFQSGDATVVCWAQGGDPAYQDAFDAFLNRYSEDDLCKMTRALLHGKHIEFNEARLDPNCPFYVLGLAPNAARLSVRFFLRNSFGAFLQNMQAHYDRLKIIKPAYEPFDYIPPWRMMWEAERQKPKGPSDKQSAKGKDDPGTQPRSSDKGLDRIHGEFLCSILTNTRYPVTLLRKILSRSSIECDVTREKAAFFKAYILQNSNTEHKEVAQMDLNEDTRYFPYVWGRIFSIFEDIQIQFARVENPTAKLNSTIKSRFFSSASTTPANVYPTLERLKNSHIDKIAKHKPGLAVNYNKALSELFSRIQSPFPKRLNTEEQIAFYLGYYHQTQKRYEKKEDPENA